MKQLKWKKSLAVFISTLMLIQTFMPMFGFADSDVPGPDIGVHEELLEEALPVDEVTVNDEVELPDQVFTEVKEEPDIEINDEATDPDVEEIEKGLPEKIEENKDEAEIESDKKEIEPRSIIDPIVNTIEFVFWVNGNQVIGPNGTQIVKDQELLIEPSVPDSSLGEFQGWFREDTGQKIDFTQPIDVAITDPPGNIKVNVMARFIPTTINVNFINDGKVIVTKTINSGERVSPDGVPVVVTEPGRVFSHWSATVGGSAFDFNTQIFENTDLYLVTAEQHKVTFVSNGGSYVQEQYVANGNRAIKPADPSRQGYTLQHWSLTNGGAEAYDFDSPVNADITLYAVWQAADNTNYTVVHWQQNAEDNDDVVADTESRTGTTGAPATYVQKNYTGFKFARASSETIAADGTTVVNVYYDRITYNFTMEALIGGRWRVLATATLRYGQSTASVYNTQAAVRPNYSWYITRNSTTAYSEAPVMPNGDLTVYGRYGGTLEYKIQYVEKATGKEIKDDYRFYGAPGLSLTIEDGITIPGFTVRPIGEWIDFGWNRTATIYYSRNNYEMTFNYNDGSPVRVVSNIPFDSDISGRAPADVVIDVTERTFNGVKYIFKGWYDDAEYIGAPYVFFGKRMPSNNLNFYAMWEAANHIVRFHENSNPGSGVLSSASVAHNGKINPVDIPDVDPTNFLGWYTYVNGNFVKFDLDSQIQSSFDLYPVWTTNGFTVEYDLNGGSGAAPVDTRRYLPDSIAKVMAPPAGSAPENKVFLGWQLEGEPNTIYYPNENITITRNIKLIAIWGDSNQYTKIVYNGNGGLDGDQAIREIQVLNNVTHNVLENTFTRDGFEFIGWNTAANGSGTSYNPGDEIMIDKENETTENILYAQWRAITKDITATKVWVNGSSPRPTIWFKLYRNIAGGYPVEVQNTSIIALPNGTLTATWVGMPISDDDGNAYTYSVREVNARGNPFTPANYSKTEIGLTVTNRYIDSGTEEPPINDWKVTGIKEWIGGEGPRPTIWFKLYRQVKGGLIEEVPGAPIRELKDGEIAVRWTGLENKNEDGDPYTFFVKEVNAEGEDFTPENYEKKEIGTKVINTFVGEPTPDPDEPDNPDPDKPDPDKPDPEKPDPDKPDPDKPDPDKPDPDKPDPDKPDPDKPKPDPKPEPKPEKPKPSKPKDDKPKLPKTGSEAAIALYGGIALVALGGAGLFFRKKKRK